MSEILHHAYQCWVCESGWDTEDQAHSCCRRAKIDEELRQAMLELASETKVQKLHADMIDRVERYVNQYHGGSTDIRSLVGVIIKLIDADRARAVTANQSGRGSAK